MAQQHLFMIEDDTRLAHMVGEYLTQSGFGFSHAGDGTAGLEQLQQHAPDLVILDLMLPDTDGLEVCRRIRALPAPMASGPVLMLTAKGEDVDAVLEALSRGLTQKMLHGTLAELRAGDAEMRAQTAQTVSRLFLRAQSKTPHNNGL
eukprot:gene36918-48164_t